MMKLPRRFTLVELLVVITLIGVLLAFLQPVHPPYDHPLHNALRNGDLIEARRLIEKGLADLNQQGYKGWTPLHYAAMGGHKDLAALLIEKGARVDARDTRLSTPLHCACLSCNAVAAFRIQNGTSVGTAEACPPDPGEFASRSRAVAELLIEKGADVNAKDNCLETPLHRAASSGQTEIARLLLSNGAHVNAKNSGGHTPLHHAADWGHIEVIELLIGGSADLDAKDSHGDTPLSCAERAGHREISALLIANGATKHD